MVCVLSLEPIRPFEMRMRKALKVLNSMIRLSLSKEESGRQFDPQVVNAFLAISADDWTQIRTQVMEKITRRRDLEI